jgi:hypothetical protein
MNQMKTFQMNDRLILFYLLAKKYLKSIVGSAHYYVSHKTNAAAPTDVNLQVMNGFRPFE